MVKWDMYRAWLRRQPVDCACIQDTGWPFTSERQDDQFVYLHSGATSRRGGLLTVIRRPFCSPNNIAWVTPLESRLQHIRLYTDSYNIVVLNIYQQPASTTDPECAHHRSELWQTLTKMVRSLPRRNCWVFRGELSTCLRHR